MTVVLSADVRQKLIESGIVPDNCRRIVIDIPYDDVTTIFYEVIGEANLLSIDWPAVAAGAKLTSAATLAHHEPV